MKIKIRYGKKADVPAAHAAFYSPVDPNDPDGAHHFTGFDPDPDGYAIVNASKERAELAKLQADKRRADAAIAKFRKPNSTDLLTEEEFAQLLTAQARLEEVTKNVPNADELRKQVAAETAKQWEGKLTQQQAANAQLQKERAAYQERLRENLRNRAAAEALAGLKPKNGLSEIAMERLARDIMLEEDAREGELIPNFHVRVRGPNGVRLDANGAPITVAQYAKSEFRKTFGELFEADDQRSGTGTPGSNPGGGGNQNKPGQRGSGRHVMKQEDMLANTGAYRETLSRIPASDALQIVDASGNVVREIPGLARA